MGDWLNELADARLSAVDLGSDPGTARRRDAMRQALKAQREGEDFARRWPELKTSEAMFPAVSWAQLERQLEDLAETPAKAAMARELVSGTRKMAAFKPPEMVLREVLCLAWALLDESFQPEEGSGATP